jgi:hypothetical protein
MVIRRDRIAIDDEAARVGRRWRFQFDLPRSRG